MRKYYLKSAQKEKFNPTDVDSDSSNVSDIENVSYSKGMLAPRRIRVIDRFGIIIQIFASRAKTRAA